MTEPLIAALMALTPNDRIPEHSFRLIRRTEEQRQLTGRRSYRNSAMGFIATNGARLALTAACTFSA
jgi:hypothetical protein